MRRPRFTNWARSELLRSTGLKTFSFRKIAAISQLEPSRGIAPVLFLYAHETDRLAKLQPLVHDPEIQAEYATVEHLLGKRSVERLALRNAPMMSLPERYRDVLREYSDAYHTPERIDAEKQALQSEAHQCMLKCGASPSHIAKQLNLDPGNLHAFLVKGETGRLTLETARELYRLLEGESFRVYEAEIAR